MQQGTVFQDELPVCLSIVTAQAEKKKKIIIMVENNDSSVSEIKDPFSARSEAEKQSA